MKNNNYFLKGLVIVSFGLSQVAFAQQGDDVRLAQEQARLGTVKVVSLNKETKLPNFIRFTEE